MGTSAPDGRDFAELCEKKLLWRPVSSLACFCPISRSTEGHYLSICGPLHEGKKESRPLRI